MTTGEFESLLAAKVAPRGPVHQLTQLFEAVRYGHWQPDAGDEQRALHSLDAILENSHQAGQGETEMKMTHLLLSPHCFCSPDCSCSSGWF